MNPICRSALSRLSLHRPLRQSSSPSFNISKRWHFGHSGSDQRPGGGGAEEGERIFRLGLASDIGLSVGKALTGYLCCSTAIIADAAHSVSDVVYMLILGSIDSFIFIHKKKKNQIFFRCLRS